MAKPHRMAVVSAAALALAVLPSSARPAFGPGDAFGLWTVALAVVAVGSLATAARRLVRAARALRGSA
jgi:hypothetical protein